MMLLLIARETQNEASLLKPRYYPFVYLKVVLYCRSLNMCKRCGDLRMVACSQCKGVGSVRKGGTFTFGMLEDIYESLGAETNAADLVACSKCRSKGRLMCPECSKVRWPLNCVLRLLMRINCPVCKLLQCSMEWSINGLVFFLTWQEQ
jgi:hypothetical protein